MDVRREIAINGLLRFWQSAHYPGAEVAQYVGVADLCIIGAVSAGEEG
jgi:hypothetical protein